MYSSSQILSPILLPIMSLIFQRNVGHAVSADFNGMYKQNVGKKKYCNILLCHKEKNIVVCCQQ